MNNKFAHEITIDSRDTQADIELSITPDLFWFKGHFSQQPLLPGVAQLDWVIHYAKKCFNDELNLLSVDVIKFQCPVLPNDRLRLHLDWNQEMQKLTFSYTFISASHPPKIASSGKLTLCQ